MMVMPGVAFDINCNRVGYGGGFYDRFLEKYPEVCRVAVGFSFQILPEVPTKIKPWKLWQRLLSLIPMRS